MTIRSAPALTSDDDRVLLTDSGHAWLFGADGAPRGDVTVATDGWAALARADTLVWTPWQTFAIPAGILVTRDGTRVAVGESPASLAVDDGSAPGTVLLTDTTAGTTLVARDATTGDELWRTDGLTSEPLLVDGAVYLPGVDDVAAVDARTGEQRWRADVGGVPLFLGTDGTHVVVLTPDRTLRALGMSRRTARERRGRRDAPVRRPGRRLRRQRVRRAAARPVPRRDEPGRRLTLARLRQTCATSLRGVDGPHRYGMMTAGDGGLPPPGPCHRGHS